MLTHYVHTIRGLRRVGAWSIKGGSNGSSAGAFTPAASANADISVAGVRWACTAAAKTPAKAADTTVTASVPARHYLHPAATTALLVPSTGQLTLHIASTSNYGATATQILVVHDGGTGHANSRVLLAAPTAAAAAAAAGGGAATGLQQLLPHTPHAAVTATAAAAAGRRPLLPSWLFGFACGSAAATAAAAVGYLNPPLYTQQQQQQQRGLHGAPAAAAAAAAAAAPGPLGTAVDQQQQQQQQQLWREQLSSSRPSSNGSSNSGNAELQAALAQVLTSMHNDATSSSSASSSRSSRSSAASSSSSSGGGDGSSSSSGSVRGGVVGSVLGFLAGLLPLGAAQASSDSSSCSSSSSDNQPQQQQQQQQLPTPWETDSSSNSSNSSSSSQAVMLRSSISEAAAAAAPAVVHLVATGAGAGAGSSSSSSSGYPGVWDGGRPQGSGFIYHDQGYILTSAHCVLPGPTAAAAADAPAAAAAADSRSISSRGSMWQFKQQQVSSNCSSSNRQIHNPSSSSSSVLVHLSDGRVYEGRVVAADVGSDLAVVKVDALEPLPTVQLGDSSRLAVGEWVVALGSPFLLKQSVSAGIVSSVGRRGSELGLAGHPPGAAFIQTDAAINAGNSGGPLVDLDGRVVAMAALKAAHPAAGVSFAIPIDAIKGLISELARHGRVRRPYAGLKMTEVPPPRMAQLRAACSDFPAAVSSGIVVTRVTPGSPAAAAGLAEDDVIVGINSSSSSSGSGSGSGSSGGGVGPSATGPSVVESLPLGGSVEASQKQQQQQRQQQQQSLGLSVSDLADALKGAMGGSLELLVVREVTQPQQQQPHTSSSSSNTDAGTATAAAAEAAGVAADGSGRYRFVRLVLHPVEQDPPDV